MELLSVLWQNLIGLLWFEELVKLFIAAALGFIVGIERESRERAAGVRTYMLISIGACSMMILARHIALDLYSWLDAGSSMRIDPGRIPSYAIASMGFMGAGVIYKEKGGVRGITTAAGMWVLTVVGLSVGAGYYALAIMTALLCFVTLFILRRFTKHMFSKNDTTITILAEDRPGQLGKIKEVLQKYSRAAIEDVKYQKQIRSKRVDLFYFEFCFPARKNTHWETVDRELETLGGIRKITMEEGGFPLLTVED